MHILVYKLKNTLLGKLFGFLLLFAIFVPLLTHYYLGKETAKDGFAPMPFHTRTKLDSIDSAGLKYEELQKEIGELNKIKISLNNELRELEGRRTQLQLEIQTYNERASAAKSKAEKVKADVGRAHRELEVIRLAKIEANDCPQLPYLRPPHRLQIVSAEQNDVDALTHTKLNSHLCQLSRCFDFSRCSLNSGFPVYIYDPAVYMIGKSPLKLNLLRIAALLKKLPYIVTDGTKACLYVVLVGSFEDNEAKSIESALQILPYWDKNGRNHLVLQLRNGTTSTEISSLDINYGFAMLAQSSFHGTRRYRHKFDMSVMPISSQESGEVWHTATFQLPAVRKYFLSFEGELSNSSSSNGITVIDLKELAAEASDFYVKTACPKQNGSFHTHDHIWTLCGDITYRATLLSQSTYTLVVGLNDKSALWDTVHIRLVEALQHGAVPVILADDVVLPFNDVINWKETAIILPMARVTEINFVLRTITNEDLLNMRWQGRFLWETYFSTTEAILHTVLATVRTRLSLPAPPLPGVASESVFDAENPPMKGALDPDAVLEIRRSSPSYYRNFTSTTVDSSHIWNSAPGALWMFPSTPFDPVLPSSAPFMHSAKGFDLIGNGEGGAGAEFSKALGGNVAKEQFTIVMLTYERELVLIEALQRLVGLQYLNKVVVVWNSPNAPLPSLQWPDIGVPIEVRILLRFLLEQGFQDKASHTTSIVYRFNFQCLREYIYLPPTHTHTDKQHRYFCTLEKWCMICIEHIECEFCYCIMVLQKICFHSKSSNAHFPPPPPHVEWASCYFKTK